MPRGHGEAPGKPPVGEGEAQGGKGSHGARHPRDHLKGDARPPQGQGLLPAPPEDHGVPLEPGHHPPLPGQGDEPRRDGLLGGLSPVALLAHGDELSLGQGEDAGVDQAVVEDHLGHLQDPQGLQGEVLRTSKPRPHQVDLPPHRLLGKRRWSLP